MRASNFLKLGALLCLGWSAVGCGGAGPSGETSPAPQQPGTPLPSAPPLSAPPSTTTPAPSAPSSGEPTPAPAPTPPSAGLQVDEDGVAMLLPANTQGSSWRLGTSDPNTQPTSFDLDGDEATQATEGALTYWTTTGHAVNYSSGAPSGTTFRLNIKAGGGTQTYTWKSGALTNGYIGTPKDLKNLEATAYVRVRGSTGTHTEMGWKLRGGKHSGSSDPRASCVGHYVPYGGRKPAWYRELNHPDYENVTLTPKFDFQLQEGKWLAVKVVSYVVSGGTHNLVYLDTDPFDASGKPRNDFRLYTEWMDKDGVSTGSYTQAATWAGWVTTFRVDGWKNLDFALLSAREIVPPAA